MITADSHIKKLVLDNPELEKVFKDYNIKVFG